MADSETKDQPETSASTPNSTAGGGSSALKASKDRSCPFCGQAFTSSSLGRHLDLYIRPKNPKAPDGVHDVNEIKKMRGSITRRQPRTNMKAGASSEENSGTRRNSAGWSSAAKPQFAKSETRFITDGSPVNSPVNAKEEGLHTWFNTPTWHATGVINNLPARAPSRNNTSTPTTGQAQRAQEMRKDVSGNRIERPEFVSEDMWKLQEAAEVGRAAEMALREVLGSLAAAKQKAEPRKLFEDIDFCALSFPGLCLALLPPPPSLFSSTPFAAAHTWALTPPGEKQFDAVTRVVNEHIAIVRNGKRENVPDAVSFKHHVHLQGAYEHWKLMSDGNKASAWNLELSRAFVREREKKQQLKADLETAQQHIKHLEAEYDRMSKCQLPREYLLHPPNTMPISSAAIREMKATDVNSGAWEAEYNADVLIDKWKSTVKATTRVHKAAPTATNSSSRHQYVEMQRNPLKADMMMSGAVFGVNGPMPRDFGIGKDEQSAITYETPKNPGAIIIAEDEAEADADGDAEDEAENAGSVGSLLHQGALTRMRSFHSQPRYESPTENGVLNANGKRPLAPGATNGKESGPKVYRMQPNA